ncbi:phage portal protein [Alteraurantiacibacter buctensis]|uniref:Phage portal protein n=1 Tax=Alteraurantiacibacter buctensis TaxID=1503981 RepID=A0A844Z1R1_9SPHN|nr:phage portal protein [Alteraurantiacibacter buctensis]MXO73176.1 phage portal protein [Alteraurantiacibacter buctensis]
MADQQVIPAPASQGGMVFTFGDPESVLDRRELSSYFEVWHNNRWYEPPLPMDTLARSFNMSPHHRSAIALKVNLLVAHMQPSRWLGADDFERFANDFMQMGNGYLERVPNMAGGMARAQVALARHTRRGTKDGAYWWVTGPMGSSDHEFANGSIYHLQQPDVAQEIYGLPEWLSALQSGLLNENATLFRRRYYLNGAHAGFILYMSEALADNETSEKIEQRLKQAKGVGNFKNMFVHIPGGKKDGIQLLPIGEVAAKDEFSSVKNISRDDLLAAHRVPPQLIGIIPQNNGGFGSVGEARDNFVEIEIVPLARRMLRMNEWFGIQVLTFRNYVCSNGDEVEFETGRRVPAGAGARR